MGDKKKLRSVDNLVLLYLKTLQKHLLPGKGWLSRFLPHLVLALHVHCLVDARLCSHLTLYTPVLLNLTSSMLALCTADPPHA